MKKVVRLNEKDIESLVEKIIKEDKNISEELPRREKERKANNFRKSSFEPYDREVDLMSIFGPYGEDIPANVIQYMRKNPSRVIKALGDVYGKEQVIKYLG